MVILIDGMDLFCCTWEGQRGNQTLTGENRAHLEQRGAGRIRYEDKQQAVRDGSAHELRKHRALAVGAVNDTTADYQIRKSPRNKRGFAVNY